MLKRMLGKAPAPPPIMTPGDTAEQFGQLGLHNVSLPEPSPVETGSSAVSPEVSRRSISQMSVTSTELDSAEENSLSSPAQRQRVWVCKQEERSSTQGGRAQQVFTCNFAVCATEALAERACAERANAWRANSQYWEWETPLVATQPNGARLQLSHEAFQVQVQWGPDEA